MLEQPTVPATPENAANTQVNAAKNAAITRGRPFIAGNPGRPKGAKNKLTRLVEAVKNGDASDILVATVRSAVAGNVQAQRLCLDRMVPLRRERTVALDVPSLRSPSAAADAASMLVEQVVAGQVTPSEGKKLLELIVTQRRLGDAGEMEKRVERLETSISVLRQDLATLFECKEFVSRGQE